MSDTIQPMPLLVIEWEGALNKAQYEAIESAITKCLDGSGWRGIVVDCMSTGRATGYLPAGGIMEAISIEDIVSRIKGVSGTAIHSTWQMDTVHLKEPSIDDMVKGVI